MKITELYIYPIKSLPGLKISTSLVTNRGLEYDRRYMFVDPQGQAITQRKHPKMALIKTAMTPDGFELNFNGEKTLIPFQISTGELMEVDVWGKRCQAIVGHDEINKAMSTFLEIPVRLVYMPEQYFRNINPIFAQPGDKLSFADGYPLLLANEASLNDLNNRLEQSVTMKRFRPNVIFGGTEPFSEDKFQNISIGNTKFNITKPCERCVMITVNPLTGEKSKEPLKTLSTYRLSDNKVMFGVNMIPRSTGEIKVGDTLSTIM